MSHSPAVYHLAPAGYLIVQEVEHARLTNEYRHAFGPYFGVDRLPSLLPPEMAIRQALGEPSVTDPRLYSALEEWFEAPYEDTAFIPSQTQARRLLKAFQECGYQFELVYCELAWNDKEEHRLDAYTKGPDNAPDISLTYGFDVSWPNCKHSAILQPGVVSSSPSWRQSLNQYGLLNDYQRAAELRTEYLGVYPYPPFDIYLVHNVRW